MELHSVGTTASTYAAASDQIGFDLGSTQISSPAARVSSTQHRVSGEVEYPMIVAISVGGTVLLLTVIISIACICRRHMKGINEITRHTYSNVTESRTELRTYLQGRQVRRTDTLLSSAIEDISNIRETVTRIDQVGMEEARRREQDLEETRSIHLETHDMMLDLKDRAASPSNVVRCQ